MAIPLGPHFGLHLARGPNALYIVLLNNEFRSWKLDHQVGPREKAIFHLPWCKAASKTTLHTNQEMWP